MPRCPCKNPVPVKNGWMKDTRWGTTLTTCVKCGHSISKQLYGGIWRHGGF